MKRFINDYLWLILIILTFITVSRWRFINQWLKSKLGVNIDTYMAGLTIAEISNNPLNIRDTGITWQGVVGQYKGFEKFDTPVNGARAGLKNTMNKRNYGHTTIEAIINVLSPPIENDTEAYINHVVNHMKQTIGDFVTRNYEPQTRKEFIEMCYSMHEMEAGKIWVPYNLWEVAFDSI